MRATKLWVALLAIIVALGAACGSDDEPATFPVPTQPGSPTAFIPTRTPTSGPTGISTLVLPTREPTVTSIPSRPTQLASHLFVPVGQSRNLEGLGELLETIHLTDNPAFLVEGTRLTAVSGGTSCLRFQYRDVDGENTVQTLCVVAFDESGNCEGLEPLTLDLEKFLVTDDQPVGNANLLESGQGLFYSTCATDTGGYRLETVDRALPRLYYTIVDALGEGAYSLGDSELTSQRAGVVQTYSGGAMRPSWILSVSREITELRLTEEGTIEFNDEDCDQVPSCTFNPSVVQPGDILRIGVGVNDQQFASALEEASEEPRDRFFEDRIGLGWEVVSDIHPDATNMAFARLAALDIMTDLVRYFDELYDLRAKRVKIGYLQPWPASTPLPFPFRCFPGEEEAQKCDVMEAALQSAETRRITELLFEGYDLWYGGFIDYGEGGEYKPLADLRPHYGSFVGIVAGVGANSTFQVEEISATLASAVERFAEEVGSETPVILSLNGPPITAQTGGGFCEADICPSDFKGMYEQSEAALDAALRSLGREQFQGFGVSLFEGSHFDIREPYEIYQGYSLNRVGETGYNNPVLNIYRAQ